MRKAKLPIAVVMVLIAVALVFAGCVQTTSVTVTIYYSADGSSTTQSYESDDGAPVIKDPPAAKQIHGWTFVGWYLNASHTEPAKFPLTLEGEKFYLYAKYEQTDSYTVTLSGGNGLTQITVPKTDPTITAPDEGTAPTGQMFDGWFLDEAYTQRVTFPYTVTDNVTFYASWKTLAADSAAIRLVGTYSDKPSVEFKKGDLITESELDPGTSENYRFAGWYLDSAHTRPVQFPYTVTENVTFYAAWENAAATITLSGSYGDQNKQFDIGATITESDLDPGVLAGNTFAGWYLDSAYTQKVAFPYTVTGNVTFYAAWNTVVGKATITLSDSYGDQNKQFDIGTTITASDLDPGVQTGNTFAGWYLDSACTRIVSFPYTVTGNVTFYAKWEASAVTTATITLDGSRGDDELTFDIDDKIYEDDLDPGSDPGYEFEGWYLNDDYSQKVEFPYTVKGDVTFYAKWTEAAAAGFVVTFDTDGGLLFGEETPQRTLEVVPAGDGTSVHPDYVPVKEGYDFVGWYRSGRPVRFPLSITRETTLVAQWKKQLDPNGTQTQSTTMGPYAAFQNIFEEYAAVEGVDNMDKLAIALEADVEGGSILLHANVLQEGGTGEFKPNDLMFKVEKDDGATFGVYISGNRLFIDIGGENGLYEVTDVQADYIAAIVAEVPGLLEELIAGAGLDSALSIFGGLEGLISMVFGIFFDSAQIVDTYSNADIIANGGELDSSVAPISTSYAIEFKLNSFTSGITDLLNMVDLGSLLGFDLDLLALFNWIKEVIPQHKVIFETEFSYPADGDEYVSVHPGLNVTYNDPGADNYGQPSWNLNIADIAFGSDVDSIEGFLDFPDNVDSVLNGSSDAVTEFSFTNLQFDVDLTLGTGVDESGKLKQLDVGKFIKVFTQDVNIPEGLIVLESDFGYKLRAQVDLDLDYDMIASGSLEDNNLILLELYPLDQFGEILTDDDGNQQKALGIYYKEGKLYVSLSSLIPNYWKANNIAIELDGVPELIAGLVTTVRTAIDEALFASGGSEGGEGGSEGGESGVSTQSLSLSATGANQLALADGGYTLSPTLGSFIDTLCKVVAIPEGILYVDGDRIVLNVEKLPNVDENGEAADIDNDIFDVIDNFMGLAGQDPISDLIPDGISAKLEFIFFEGGLESVDITGAIELDDGSGVNIGLSVNNFLIGVKDGELESRIDSGIGDTTNYTTNLGELMNSALEGIDLNMNLALTFDAGQYNIGDFIAGLGLPQLEGVPLAWTFDSNFQMDLGLHIQISLDKANPANSMLAVEIIANKPIYIGEYDNDTHMPVVAQPAGLLVGIYGFYDENGAGRVAIDLSHINIANIQFPKLSAELDFANLVFGLLDKLKIDLDGEAGPNDPVGLDGINLSFNLSDLLDNKDDNAASGASVRALSTEDIVENPGESISDTNLTEAGSLIVGLNSEALYASFSLAAVQELLEAFGVSLGNIELDSFKIDVDNLNLSRLDGITIEASGTLMEKENVVGGASTDQNLKLTLALGNEEYPIALGLTEKLKTELETKTGNVAASIDEYEDEIIALVLDLISTSRIELEMNLSTLDSQMDLTQIINNVLASQGKQLNLPIELYLDEWDPTVTLVVEWQLDTSAGTIGHDSKIQISLVYQEKELLGVALSDGDAIVRLDGLGLFNVNLSDSPLIDTLITMIQNLISEAQGTELSDLINGLLTSIDGSDPTINVADVAANGTTSGETGGETGGETEEALQPWIKALLRSISANNTTLLVDLTTDIVDEVVRGLAGFSLGIDIGAGIEFDIVNGALSLDLQINDNIALDALLSLAIGQENVDQSMLTSEQIAAGQHYTIDVGTDAAMIDGATGMSIAQGLFDNLNLNLQLDIRNNNADTGNADQYLRLSVRKLNTDTALANTGGKVAPRGSFLIQLGTVNEAGYNDTQSGGMDTIVYAVFNYQNNALTVSGQSYAANSITIYVKQGWIEVFSGALDVGEIVNGQNLSISLASTDGDGNTVGIIEQIGTLLDGLISQLENMTSSDETTETEQTEPSTQADQPATQADTGSSLDMSALTEVFADLDIMELLGGGIDIKFNATGTFNADISFDAYVLNTLIDGLMDKILGPNSILDLSQLAPDMFTQHHLRNIAWDRDGGLWNNLAQVVKDDIIPDLVASETVKGAVNGMDLSFLLGLFGGTIDNVLNTVKPLITTLLPFPVMDTVNAGLNFVDGTLANIYITGYDTNTPIKSADGTEYTRWTRHDGNALELWIYNQFTSVGATDNVVAGTPESGGIVDWGEIPRTVVYEPYQYNVSNYPSFVDSNFANKTARFQRGTLVIKQGVTFTFADNVPVYGGQDVAAVLNSHPDWLNKVAAAGGNLKNKYEINVSANFKGSERSMTIYLAVNPTNSSIVSIEPITRYAYSGEPEYLVLNFANGTSRSVSWTAVADTQNFEPTTYTEHSKDAKVTFVNGTTAGLTVNYLDSTAAKLINSDGLKMSVDLYMMTEETTSITQFTPQTLYFNYPDGAAVAMPVDEWINTEGLDALLQERIAAPDNMTAINGEITAIIGKDTAAKQEITIQVEIRTKVKASLKFGDFYNKIQINPYDVYLDEINKDDADNGSGVLPNTAIAYYSEDGDSYSETVYITIENFELPEVSYNSSERIKAAVSLDEKKYGGYFDWTQNDIDINIVSNTISKVWFADPSSPTGYSDRLIIDPYVYNSFETTEEKLAYFPTTALIEFSNGYACELPIRFPELNVDELYVEYDSYNDQQKIQIGFAPDEWTSSEKEALEGRFLQEALVYFEFEGKEIARYNIDGYDQGTYLEIDPVDVLLRGANPLPDTVEVVYTDSTVAEIEVSSWDELVITADSLNDKDGSTGTVTGQLTADGRNEFTLNYRILPRYDMRSADITFDSFDYTFDSNGNIGFDVISDTIAVSFSDGTMTEEPIFDEDGVQTGTQTVDTVHTYFLAVTTWDTTGANFGSGAGAGGIVTALFEDIRNGGYVNVPIKLINNTLEPVTEAGSYDVTYLGLDYVVAMSTMGADGNLTSMFTNFNAEQVAQRAIYNTQVTMAFYTGEEDEDGNKLTTMRIVMADIELDDNVPVTPDAFNQGGRKAFNINLDATPQDQGASEFSVTVTVKDGAGAEVGTVTLPLYFGYSGPTQSGETV